MTVVLLKQVLSEMGITFKPNASKADPITKVKEARAPRAEFSERGQGNKHGKSSTKMHIEQVQCNPKKQSSSVIFYVDLQDRWLILLFIIICAVVFLFEFYSLFFSYNVDIINMN